MTSTVKRRNVWFFYGFFKSMSCMHQAQCQQKIDLKVVYTVAHCNRNCWKRTIPHCKVHNSRITLQLLQQREFLLNKTCDVKALFVSPLTSIQLAPSCSGLLSLHISARLCGVFASIEKTIGFDRPDRSKLDVQLGRRWIWIQLASRK